MRGKLFQLQTAIACSFGQTIMAILMVWPSYTISIYTNNSTTPLTEPITPTELSLLGSLPSLGAMAGTAIIGILIDKLGRKNGGVVMSLPYVLSWAMLSATRSKMVVLAARFLGGMSGGGLLVYAPVFISEVAEDSFRGTLASSPILLYCSGTLLSYILGWTMSYYVIIWVNLALCISSILLIMSVAESPVYLLKQNRDEDARAAIAHYRGSSPNSMLVLEEFSKLKQQLMPAVELISVTAGAETKEKLKAEEEEREKLNTENIEPEVQQKMSPIKLLFTSLSSQRAFIVVLVTISTQVLMGMNAVQVYAKTVFAQSDPERADLFTVIFALVLVCGSMVTAAVADKAGRRILIIGSSVLVGLCMMTLGFLMQSQVAPAWVTVVTIMSYCFAFMAGAGSVPYVLLAEVFTSEVQNIASIIIVEWVWFLNFFLIGVFPFMNTYLGLHGSFYVFSTVSIINAVVSYFIVPETKGLSTEQIQEVFLGRKKK